jgi:hypothetical protein
LIAQGFLIGILDSTRFLFWNSQRPGSPGRFRFPSSKIIVAAGGTNYSPPNWNFGQSSMSLISKRLPLFPLDMQAGCRLYVAESHLQGIASASGFARTGLEEIA